MDPIGESQKYYRDDDGFIYKKCGENAQTLYLDCVNQPNCTARAKVLKEMGEVIKTSTHSDEKATENVVNRIAFEASLKNAARKEENFGVSVLNLYKRAIADNKGIWLPMNHQTNFLTKLRRIRKYEKQKNNNELDQQQKLALNTIDVDDAPTTQVEAHGWSVSSQLVNAQTTTKDKTLKKLTKKGITTGKKKTGRNAINADIVRRSKLWIEQDSALPNLQ